MATNPEDFDLRSPPVSVYGTPPSTPGALDDIDEREFQSPKDSPRTDLPPQEIGVETKPSVVENQEVKVVIPPVSPSLIEKGEGLISAIEQTVNQVSKEAHGIGHTPEQGEEKGVLQKMTEGIKSVTETVAGVATAAVSAATEKVKETAHEFMLLEHESQAKPDSQREAEKPHEASGGVLSTVTETLKSVGETAKSVATAAAETVAEAVHGITSVVQPEVPAPARTPSPPPPELVECCEIIEIEPTRTREKLRAKFKGKRTEERVFVLERAEMERLYDVLWVEEVERFVPPGEDEKDESGGHRSVVEKFKDKISEKVTQKALEVGTVVAAKAERELAKMQPGDAAEQLKQEDEMKQKERERELESAGFIERTKEKMKGKAEEKLLQTGLALASVTKDYLAEQANPPQATALACEVQPPMPPAPEGAIEKIKTKMEKKVKLKALETGVGVLEGAKQMVEKMKEREEMSEEEKRMADEAKREQTMKKEIVKRYHVKRKPLYGPVRRPSVLLPEMDRQVIPTGQALYSQQTTLQDDSKKSTFQTPPSSTLQPSPTIHANVVAQTPVVVPPTAPGQLVPSGFGARVGEASSPMAATSQRGSLVLDTNAIPVTGMHADVHVIHHSPKSAPQSQIETQQTTSTSFGKQPISQPPPLSARGEPMVVHVPGRKSSTTITLEETTPILNAEQRAKQAKQASVALIVSGVSIFLCLLTMVLIPVLFL